MDGSNVERIIERFGADERHSTLFIERPSFADSFPSMIFLLQYHREVSKNWIRKIGNRSHVFFNLCGKLFSFVYHITTKNILS